VLRDPHKKPDFVQEIKSRSLGRFEHLVSMEDRSMVKILVMGNPGGKERQQGRAMKSWLDDVDNGSKYSVCGGQKMEVKSTVRELWAANFREI
jgi:hypothetical protein